MNINLTIFHFINNAAGHSKLLDSGMVFLTTYLAYSVSIIVALYVCVWLPFKRSRPMTRLRSLAQGTELFFSTLVTAVIVTVLKVLIAEPRPFVTLTNVHLLITETGYSFPSRHATITFAIATIVYLYHRSLGKWLYVFASLVAISRIFVGVHYPIDVIAGALLGITIPHIIHWAFSQITKNKVQ